MPRATKTADESQVERVQILLQADLNGVHRLFGGRLMEWIDLTAAAVARRHSGHNVTTVLVDQLEFKAPAYSNDMVVLEAKIIYTGTTSMEVRVDSFAEALDGTRKLVNTAHVTLVAIDENDRPCEVPLLVCQTPEEQTAFDEAKARHDARRAARRD